MRAKSIIITIILGLVIILSTTFILLSCEESPIYHTRHDYGIWNLNAGDSLIIDNRQFQITRVMLYYETIPRGRGTMNQINDVVIIDPTNNNVYRLNEYGIPIKSGEELNISLFFRRE